MPEEQQSSRDVSAWALATHHVGERPKRVLRVKTKPRALQPLDLIMLIHLNLVELVAMRFNGLRQVHSSRSLGIRLVLGTRMRAAAQSETLEQEHVHASDAYSLQSASDCAAALKTTW